MFRKESIFLQKSQITDLSVSPFETVQTVYDRQISDQTDKNLGYSPYRIDDGSRIGRENRFLGQDDTSGQNVPFLSKTDGKSHQEESVFEQ